MSWRIGVFGVRHLSPMGAWHLRQFLDQTKPELVLIEGLDDATELLEDVTRRETKPPIAILAYTSDLPVRTLVYPFATYSPEYQAIRWASEHRIRAEFFDLPSSCFLGLRDVEIELLKKAREAEPESATETSKSVPEAPDDEDVVSLYQRIAEAAGERDYDTYWERHFEHNAATGCYQKAAFELGETIRELEPEQPRWRAENLVREAYMRRRIEQAIADGYRPEKIVAVVGAFHAPVLNGDHAAMTDDELARLPRRSSKLTLMPYSYFKLSSQSGYGAGNLAPAYFERLWEALNAEGITDLSRRYLSAVARNLREAGTHRSTAEVIEAVRLAETLSALKDGVAPTHRDLRDAAVTLLGHGELTVVAESLAKADVGTEIGSLPRGVSQTSIQEDFDRQLRELKLEKYRTSIATELDLDLRENRRVKSEEAAFLDLRRSSFFHRLRVLGIPFVQYGYVRQDSANWAERWTLQWSPESEIALVEAVLLGETVELATAFKFMQALRDCHSIADAGALVQDACQCAMIEAMEQARVRLQALAVHSHDFCGLAAATGKLAMVVRYGDVRRIDVEPLVPLVQELFVQGTLSLFASANCDDKAAADMLAGMDQMNKVSLEMHDRVEEGMWLEQLQLLADADDRNPVVSGYACALLLERGLIENSDLAKEVSRRLSPGVPADLGAGWFEGLAKRNRYSLLARQTLWEQLADYVKELDEEQFRRALVFLRRAFGSFSAREKRSITENLGEMWGMNKDVASEMLEKPLTEEEEEKLQSLDEFGFDDL